ncbi:hypothetical protein ACGFS9_05915 [Streptomyces sp. NPDC048566]|uniref:hypothetical protein n=1 Tax=Streptomyces sp. NPDC048566 TaxID=3365569 RepID=UPI003720B8F8
MADLAWLEFLIRLRGTGMPIARCSGSRSCAHGATARSPTGSRCSAHSAGLAARMRALRRHAAAPDEKIHHDERLLDGPGSDGLT